jgi:hypothetical protein
MADKTGHELISTGNRKAGPTMWCLSFGGDYMEIQWDSSSIKYEVFLIASPFQYNDQIIFKNVITGTLFYLTNTLCHFLWARLMYKP